MVGQVGWEGVDEVSPGVAWLEHVAASLQLWVALVLVACLSPYLFQLPLVYLPPFLPHFLSPCQCLSCFPLAQDVVALDGFEEEVKQESGWLIFDLSPLSLERGADLGVETVPRMELV